MKRLILSLFGSCLFFACGQTPQPVEVSEIGCNLETANRECSQVLLRTLEEIEEFCARGCVSADSLSFGRLDGVETLSGFDNLKSVRNVSISGTHNVREWDILNNVEEAYSLSFNSGPREHWYFRGFENTRVVTNITVDNSSGIRTFHAFQNIESLTHHEPDSDAFSRNTSAIRFDRTESLKEIGDFYELRHSPFIGFLANDSLQAIPNFPKLEVVRGLVITDNPNVDSLPDLHSLRRIESALAIENNGAIRQCEVDSLLAQLEEPPEEIILAGLSDEPCD